MKIKIGKKVYLQRYDLRFITRDINYMPQDILDELYEEKMWDMIGNDDQKSALDFDCVFEKPGSVAWLMNRDWILDYKEFMQMQMVDIKALLFKKDAKFHALIDKRNMGDIVDWSATNSNLDRLRHVIESIEIIIEYKEGRIQPELPAAMYKKKFSNDWLKSIFRLFKPNAR